jgi:hypothetical protein
VTPALWIVSNEEYGEPKRIYVQQASYVVLGLCMPDQKNLHKDVGAVLISSSEDVARLEAIVVGYLSALGVKDRRLAQLLSSVKDDGWGALAIGTYSVATEPSLCCLQANLLPLILDLPWFALIVDNSGRQT